MNMKSIHHSHFLLSLTAVTTQSNVAAPLLPPLALTWEYQRLHGPHRPLLHLSHLRGVNSKRHFLATPKTHPEPASEQPLWSEYPPLEDAHSIRVDGSWQRWTRGARIVDRSQGVWIDAMILPNRGARNHTEKEEEDEEEDAEEEQRQTPNIRHPR